MAKIENTVVYPTVTPTASDLLIATDVSNDNKTVTFKVGDLIGPGGVPQDLQSVLNVGNTAVQNIVLTGNIDAFTGYINTNEYQVNGSAGTVGQVLTSGGPGGPSTWTTPTPGTPEDIQDTLAVGNTTTLSMTMNGAGELLTITGGTDLVVTGTGSDLNIGAGSDINLSSTTSLNFTTDTTINDANSYTGAAGDILTVDALGNIAWSSTVPGAAVPPLQDVLNVGHIATGGPGISMTSAAPLVLDATSNISSAGNNQFTGTSTFTYQGASLPAIILQGGLQDSAGSLGTPKQFLAIDPTDNGKVLWRDATAVASQNLQDVLDTGNEATQSINLHGDMILDDGSGAVTGSLILGANVPILDNTSGTLPTVGYVLTATATGVAWAAGGGGGSQNLSSVLGIGNTADNNIILTDSGGLGANGNITCVTLTSTSIIATNGIGATGQILSVNALGQIEWITNTATGMTQWNFQDAGGTPSIQTVVNNDTVVFDGGIGITTTSANINKLTIDLTDQIVGTTAAYPSSVTVNNQGQVTAISAGTAPLSYALGSQSAGSNVELDLTDSTGAVTTVTLVGTGGITLTDNGSNQITINAAAAAGMTSFDISSDSGAGSTQTVTNGVDYLFEGGTYITTFQTGGTPNTLTLNHDATTRSDTTSSASPAFGGTFTAVTTVTTNATGHLTALNTETITLPSSAAVTSVAASTGLKTLSGSPITNTGTVIADYTSATNIVKSGTAGYVGTPVATDTMLFNETATNTVYEVALSQLSAFFTVGTVLSVSASITGTAMSVAVTNPTTNPAIATTFNGTASDYINGAGDLVALSTLDTTYDLSSVQNVADADIKLVGSDGTTDIVKLVAGPNITLTDTGSNITIQASASSGLTSFLLSGDSGTPQTVSAADPTLDINGGTVISTVASATNQINVNHNAVSRTDVPTSSTPAAGNTIPIVTAITSSTEGHITAAAINTITWPQFVSSIGLSYSNAGGAGVAGNPAYVVGSSPIAGAGTISLTGQGTSAQYIDGTGSLQTLASSLPVYTVGALQSASDVDFILFKDAVSSSVVKLKAGSGVTLTESTGSNIEIALASSAGTVTSVGLNYSATGGAGVAGSAAFVVSSSSTNPITGAGDFTITADGTVTQYVTGMGKLKEISSITGTEYDLTTTSPGAGLADINLVPSTGVTDVVQLDIGSNMTVSVAGNVISLDAVASVGLTDFNVGADSGTVVTINSGNNTFKVEGASYQNNGGPNLIDTYWAGDYGSSAGTSLFIAHTPITTTTSATADSPLAGQTVDLVKSITTDGYGHTTAVETSTVLWPADIFASLTTLGTTGPATLTTGVLNIPDYSSGALGGTVTSVGLTYTTNTGAAGAGAAAFSIVPSGANPITTAGSFEIQPQGTSLQFIDGTGALRTITAISGGWSAKADTGATQVVAVGDTVDFQGYVGVAGGGIVTTTSSLGPLTPQVEFKLIDNGANVQTNKNFYRGDGNWAVPLNNVYQLTGTDLGPNDNQLNLLSNPVASPNFVKFEGSGGTTVTFNPLTDTFEVDSSGAASTNFNVAGSAGTPQNIVSGDTLTIAAGTGIGTVASSPGTVTVLNTGVTNLSIDVTDGGPLYVDNNTGAVTLRRTGIEPLVKRDFFGTFTNNNTVTQNFTEQFFQYVNPMWGQQPAGLGSTTYYANNAFAASSQYYAPYYPFPKEKCDRPITDPTSATNNETSGYEGYGNAALYVCQPNLDPAVDPASGDFREQRIGSANITMSGNVSIGVIDTGALNEMKVKFYKGRPDDTGTTHHAPWVYQGDATFTMTNLSSKISRMSPFVPDPSATSADLTFKSGDALYIAISVQAFFYSPIPGVSTGGDSPTYAGQISVQMVVND